MRKEKRKKKKDKFVYLFIPPSACLSVSLPVCLSVCLCICLSVHQLVYLSHYLSVWLCNFLFICLYISINRPVFLSVYQLMHRLDPKINIYVQISCIWNLRSRSRANLDRTLNLSGTEHHWHVLVSSSKVVLSYLPKI